ncbi:nucleotidyltransferase [Bifidobacterium sp. DSM 109957]|uniref:Nucleotidyltransferase n=2 Tax=Bifidobacterium oedipodis TaxID=2675322 RepID=A0A7Y0EMT6_9BIFI|nr:nucleotidyltransferase [Bifidobacterium sp. DSM 109957]
METQEDQRVDDGMTLTPAPIAQIARPIARANGICQLYLFGSRANGNANPDSDVDFLYSVDQNTNRVTSVREFRQALRDALGTDVDLVRKDYLTEPIENPLAALQRDLFVSNIMSHKVYRILPQEGADNE